MTADFDTITVPRPKPGEVVIAVCDADGASCWTTASKATFADEGFATQILPFLEEGQQRVHEQRTVRPGHGAAPSRDAA